MDKINSLFKNKICINLDRRPDRWLKVDKIFNKFNLLNIIRLSAKDGQNIDIDLNKEHKGELGSAISHYEAIKMAKDLGWENVLIFEDDVQLSEDLHKICNQILDKIPSDWDILYFGGNHVYPLIKIDEHFYRIQKSYALQMYAVNSKCYDYLLQYLKNCIDHFLNNSKQKFISLAGDYFIGEIQYKLHCYTIYPKLSWQSEDFSDIQHTKVDYSFLKK